MNKFCVDLLGLDDIKIFNSDMDPISYIESRPYFHDETRTHSNGNKHIRLPDEDLSDEFKTLFSSRGLRLICAEFFYIAPNQRGVIHTDPIEVYTDIAKLNWVFGGTFSLMNWYETNENYQPDSGDRFRGYTITGSPTSNFRPNEVNLIHSQEVGCPSIVQVGWPHNVTNDYEPRYCISTIFEDAITNKRLSFDETIERFK